MNIQSLVIAAINVFDPVACMHMEYEVDVENMIEMLLELRQSEPALVEQLNPTNLANMMEIAEETGMDIMDVIRQELSKV